MKPRRGFKRVQRLAKSTDEPTYTKNAAPRLREKEAGTGIPVISFLNVRYAFPDINTARRILKMLTDAHESHDIKALGKALATAKPYKTGFKTDPARKNSNVPIIDRLIEIGKISPRIVKAKEENEKAVREEANKREEAKDRKKRRI